MSNVAITRLERDTDRQNRRGHRYGLFGGLIDRVTGKGLDRQAAVFGVKRERAKLFGWTMPWGEPDEALRVRAFLAYQSVGAPPPCIHNVWGGYDDGTKCEDCGEWLCLVPREKAEKMHLFITKLGAEK